MFGVDCASGNTLTGGNLKYTMTSMHVPEPVLSLAVSTAKREQSNNFVKALTRFQREDPTFRVHSDRESGEVQFFLPKVCRYLVNYLFNNSR
jgi:elongation factor G